MTASTQRKPGRPPDEAGRQRREEEILDAAARLFAQRGFSEANTQELADTLGVGKGTIYRYFPSKEDLFLAAVDRAMRQVTATVDRAVEGLEEPLERMLCAMQTYLAFFAQHPEYVELIMQERAQFKDRKKPTYFVHRDANVERWRAAFRALIATGRVRDVPVERITDVLSDMLYGRMFTNYFVGSTRSPEQQAQDIFDIAFYGLLSEAERTKG
jgi:AcrR family transcriptional regulator